jgi:hypothetical protein
MQAVARVAFLPPLSVQTWAGAHAAVFLTPVTPERPLATHRRPAFYFRTKDNPESVYETEVGMPAGPLVCALLMAQAWVPLTGNKWVRLLCRNGAALWRLAAEQNTLTVGLACAILRLVAYGATGLCHDPSRTPALTHLLRVAFSSDARLEFPLMLAQEVDAERQVGQARFLARKVEALLEDNPGARVLLVHAIPPAQKREWLLEWLAMLGDCRDRVKVRSIASVTPAMGQAYTHLVLADGALLANTGTRGQRSPWPALQELVRGNPQLRVCLLQPVPLVRLLWTSPALHHKHHFLPLCPSAEADWVGHYGRLLEQCGFKPAVARLQVSAATAYTDLVEP